MRCQRFGHRVLLASVALLGGALIAAASAPASTLPDGFEESLLVEGLDTPTSMAFAPDGRIFVAEKAGRVRIVADGVLRPTPFLTMSVSTGFEHGLDGIVLDPQFATNRYLYVYYAPPTRTTNRLSRFTASVADPFVVEPNSEVVLIDGIPGSTGFHNGGFLHFGTDGMLYVGTGDSAVKTVVQDLGTLGGKILRIDPASYPNVVPPDNPFVATAGARGEIWAVGVRNPFSGAIDPATGLLYVNDVGAEAWEEIDDVRRGMNYGWPVVEGPGTNPAYVDPIHAYPHAGTGAAITGGVFYRGAQFPAAFQGKYFFADYVRRFVRVLDPEDATVSDFVTDAPPVLDLDVGPDGSLYALVKNDGTYAFSNSAIRVIAYVGAANRAPSAVAAADPTSGAPPLAVAFSGAGSDDPDGDALTYTWDFGDGSAPGDGVEAEHVYATPGTFFAVLTVRDPGGLEAVSDPITITTDDTPPVAEIVSPEDGSRYRAGDTITFAGLGIDAEDGELPDSAYTWEVVLHHNTHVHPGLGPFSGAHLGSFDVPLVGETDPDQWYRFHLVVTDSSGLTGRAAVDVVPETGEVSLVTNVPGLALALDEQTVAAPFTFVGVAGAPRTIEAPLEQRIGGITYAFRSWSDGGESTHAIETPSDTRVVTASYGPVVDGTAYSADRARLYLSWRGHDAGRLRDRVTVVGRVDPRTLPTPLAGHEMRLSVNGVELARGVINVRGRYTDDGGGRHVGFRISERTGRYRVGVTHVDLRALLGVAAVTEKRELPVGVTIEVVAATAPLLDDALPFSYRSRANVAASGTFSR
jgi:glucose/arabinose dehydrogenase/PKD repeat protein